MKRFFLAFFLFLCVLVAYEYITLPDVSSLTKENPKITALMRQRETEARIKGRKQPSIKAGYLIHWSPAP
jgi:hypothetical protein